MPTTIDVLSHFSNVRRSGDGWVARCPAHEDKNPSLAIHERDGKVLVHCHAGCATENVLAAVGLTMADLFAGSAPEPRIVATYPYTDEADSLLFEVVRYEPKSFRQRRPDGRGGWVWNLDGVRRVLYRLPEVCAAKAVLVVEGEKDVETARGLGFTATCNPGGAGKWRNEYAQLLRGKRVGIIADADEPGRKHAQEVAASLSGRAEIVKVLKLLGAKDLTQWTERGGTCEQLHEILKSAPILNAAASPSGGESPSAGDWAPLETGTRDYWPEPLAPEAFYGLAGDFVRAVEPYTESDNAALLAQFLVGFGNLIGRSAYFSVESSRHYGNLFCVLVGETSKGRKGTSWANVRRPLAAIDPAWADTCIQTGLSSGEGLVASVRDAIERRDPIKKNGRVEGYETVIADHGVADKRLLVIETEFSSPLRVAARDGNTLTGVVRQAWDTGELRLLTKNNPVKSTGAHIGIIGHITKDELVRHITTTDLANGYANRFLWVCVKRSKQLPEGGQVPEDKMGEFARRLMATTSFARMAGRVERDEGARELWREIYGELSEGAPGLLGAVTSRAEAQVVRLSMLYALLDRSTQIRREHLVAGVAFWEYCAASARATFGDAFGDPVVDELLSALRHRAEGLTRTEIRDTFQRNRSAWEISRALNMLSGLGYAVRVKDSDTGGRPSERWMAATRVNKAKDV